MDIDRVEEEITTRQRNTNNSEAIFTTKGSAGANPEKLAQILTAFDFAINILGWQDKPLANLTKFLTQYQASIDSHYHNDYKDVLVSEEIERKRAERKGISILSQ